MKLLVTFILLMLNTVPASGEWLQIREDIATGQTVYVDPDTIHRKGDMAEMWALYDYKTAQSTAGAAFLSSKVQNEYNCTQEMRRMVSVTEFAGNMGSGKVVHMGSSLFSNAQWMPARSGLGETLLKLACGKK